jgi:hypothetical protein
MAMISIMTDITIDLLIEDITTTAISDRMMKPIGKYPSSKTYTHSLILIIFSCQFLQIYILFYFFWQYKLVIAQHTVVEEIFSESMSNELIKMVCCELHV